MKRNCRYFTKLVSELYLLTVAGDAIVKSNVSKSMYTCEVNLIRSLLVKHKHLLSSSTEFKLSIQK